MQMPATLFGIACGWHTHLPLTSHKIDLFQHRQNGMEQLTLSVMSLGADWDPLTPVMLIQTYHFGTLLVEIFNLHYVTYIIGKPGKC